MIVGILFDAEGLDMIYLQYFSRSLLKIFGIRDYVSDFIVKLESHFMRQESLNRYRGLSRLLLYSLLSSKK